MEDVATLVCVPFAGPFKPLTQEVIFKVGALLKEGKYRSSAHTSVSQSSGTGKQSIRGPTRWIWQFSRPFGP